MFGFGPAPSDRDVYAQMTWQNLHYWLERHRGETGPLAAERCQAIQDELDARAKARRIWK